LPGPAPICTPPRPRRLEKARLGPGQSRGRDRITPE
jgi:hypothetical protein